ncbi:YqeB family protein [Micromonospora sp. URMC 103]|uniref:YqeB family protein n=1 Tax=Micromonospora sp. URMC 103 TaxID=3423406 RepID=UPI003F1A68EC
MAGGSGTRVGGAVTDLVVMWGGFPLLGAGAGALLAVGAGAISDLPWVPLKGLFEALSRLPQPQVTVGAALVGVVAGLLLAGAGTAERLTVTVDGQRVRLRRDGRTREVPRHDVRGVLVDGRSLVLLDTDGGELVRETSDLSRDRLRSVFREHGWPWAEEDPYRAAYRLWVDGLPGLPEGADALLRARERAIGKDRRDDVRELRRELGRIGVVVRDEDGRQYWRLTGRAVLPPADRPAPARPDAERR